MAGLLDDPHTLSAVPAAAGETDPPEPPPPLDESARARALLAAQPVVEGRVEFPTGLDPEDFPPVRAPEAGAQFWSVHVGPGEGVVGALRRIDAIRALVAACPEDLRLAHGTTEMAQALNHGRVAALLGPVSANALGGSLATLRAYHALGVRAVTLTGFDRFVRDAVREMNRLGLAVDLSGAAPDTVREVLAVAKAPVLMTEGDPASLPDEVLRLLGGNEGVCMVPVAEDPAATADVLDRVHTLAGSHSVGLSHAKDPVDGYVPLFAELLRRGWPAQDLVLLAHANTTRALRQTEFRSRATRLRTAA
ncbi:membrane dipeptidase [Streptomyces sp. NBC_01216]|uniref:membrane dipeptidase n=1 Tax=unclassified Streptomyces TaxID=2593676 RepID=UPI002E11DC8F|nr:dipeptidase [Streptomyces sp. NBC_01216]